LTTARNPENFKVLASAMARFQGQGHKTGFSDFSLLQDRAKSLWTR